MFPETDSSAPTGQPFDNVQDPPQSHQARPAQGDVRNPSSVFPRYTSFHDFIREAEYGQLNADLSATLAEIVAACTNHAMDHSGKVEASLSIKFKFKLVDGLFSIEADPSVKLPKPERGVTRCWATPDNFLTPQDPKQLTMFGGRQVTADHMRGRPVRTA